MPEILAEVAPGTDVRRPGTEMRAGTVLRTAGARLRALDAAIAEAAGIAEVSVREPVVALEGRWLGRSPGSWRRSGRASRKAASGPIS